MIFSLVFFGDSLIKIQFETLLLWIDDQHCLHYKCHCLMINHDNLTILKLIISYYMNMKYPCNLWKPLEPLLTLQNRIEDENVTIKQA